MSKPIFKPQYLMPSIVLGDNTEIVNYMDGSLFCEDHKKNWCDHIKKVVTYGLDADKFWSSEPRVETCEIDVPMVPTLFAWEHVRLEYFAPVKAYRVTQVIIDGSRASEEFIGFVNSGELRKILREMLFEWFRGHANGEDLKECTSNSHSFASQMQWEKMMKEAGTRLIHQWILWRYEACAFCLGMAEPDDFRDLVPEKPNTTSPFAKKR
jgi:hypothetical protein